MATAPAPERPAENPWTRRNLATILGLTVIVSLIAQRWSGLDTPDSSFYASLSLFGDAVTDRAPDDSYFWTRLGYIAPVRGLTLLLGPWIGFAVYKTLLLLLITGSAYLLLKRHTNWVTATFLTATVTTSTVVLSYLGNTYLTGTVLAGTAVLIALGTSPRAASSAVAGVTMGWLAMVNPAGALLAGTLWLALMMHSAQVRGLPIRTRLTDLGLAALTAVATGFAFLAIGKVIFPTLDWLGSYLDAQEMNLSNFASADAVWLRDISLLVPAAIAVIVVITWIRRRRSIAAQQAFIISITSIAFMLVFSPMMGGIALEAPMYQAMLWPPALIALALAATAHLDKAANTAGNADENDEAAGRKTFIAAPIGIAVIIGAGFLAPNLSFVVGLIIIAALAVVVLLSPPRTIAMIVTVSTFLAGAQLLQNSRDDLGLYYLSPYSWAYASNPISEKLHTAVNAQEWLLANTSREDTILLWVDGPWTQGDRELYVAAGMQLWGENRITLEPTLTDEYGISTLSSVRPSVLALYGKDMNAITTFWESIPRENDPTAPICYDYAWPADDSSDFPTTQGHTCLTRLTW